MAKKKDTNTGEVVSDKEQEQVNSDALSLEKMIQLATKLIKQEYQPWKTELKKFWPDMDRRIDAYEFFKEEYSKTNADITLATPFGLIESYIARSNEVKLNVGAEAKGLNGLQDVEEYVAAVVKDAIYDKDVAILFGTFRKRTEMYKRDYFIIGNAFSEDQYIYQTRIINGEKKVIADNPYTEALSYKNVIFNPAYYADNSPVYWVEKNASYQSLKDNEYDEETGKGLYKNLDLVKKVAETSKKLIDSEDEKMIQNGAKVARKIEPIQLLIRWEGPKMTVIADGKVIIREAWDPFKVGHHNLHISMNYKKTGRPYAYGEIDAIYKIARAQDTIINQNIESVTTYLEPAATYDPDDLSLNVDQIMDILEFGGVAPAKKDSVNIIQRALPPQQAFTTIETLQQSEERAARYNPYANGTPNQVSDNTKGTKGGIQAIIQASEPNFQTKLDDLEDSYFQPLAMNYLKMIANLMGEDEIRYSKLRGKKSLWVKATKNLLMGNLDLNELLRCEVITRDDYMALITDPTTGQVNPELAKVVKYDIDWLIDINLDNQAEADKMQKIQKKQEWFEKGKEYGLPMDDKKFHTDLGVELDIEDPEQYYKDPQVLAEEQQKAAEVQAQQAQDQQAQADQANQNEIAKEVIKHKMGLEMEKAKAEAKAQATPQAPQGNGVREVSLDEAMQM